MVDDTVGLLDHLGLDAVHIAGYSMGGWVAETLAYRHPERVRSAVFIGSCNVGTSWEKAITTVERDLARLDNELPPLVQRGGDACGTCPTTSCSRTTSSTSGCR